MNNAIRNPDDATSADYEVLDGGRTKVEADPEPTSLPQEGTEGGVPRKAALTWDISDWFKVS